MAGRSSRGAGEKDVLALPSHSQATSRDDLSSGRPSESFPKRNRLLKRTEYVRVQRRGRKLTTKSMLMLVYPGKKGRTRLGIVASKKLGNSVVRNRLKRLLREVFRRNRNLFPESSDLVIIPKKVSHQVDYHSLKEEFRKLSGRGKR